MAEAILFGLAQKMIENLGSQTFQEFGSLWGVEGELEKIKETVSTIQAVLQDAAEQQSHNHQVKHWLEKLNDAVYDADDQLSEFSTEATRRSMVRGNKLTKEVRTFFSKSNQLAFRGKMSRKIKAMRQKLNAIAEDKNKFNLKVDNVENNATSRKRETHSFVPGEVVIGRDEDKKNIIDLLFDSNVEENVSVIPIVGIGGLGKTTLAQYVYNDEKVQKYFELKMWACISDVFDLKIIIEKIIASTSDNALAGNLVIDQLQSQLRKKIDGKKYLLVLDDIWNEDPENWRELKSLLMGGFKGSKIIITSRLRLVADITCKVPPYFLNGLSQEQSWVLFRQVAFRNGQEANNPKLVTIGKEIVNMCQGVPLAIKSIGNLLYFKEEESEWSFVKDNIEANVIQENGILPILKLSYDHLPSHLKSCFTYCSLFPKDYEMDKETVIQLWIAQGFVQSSIKNQQLEDVGNEYFKDLLWRSFFEEINVYGDLKYKMHDLIHDLAEAIAGEECRLISFDGKNINEKNRHVSCPLSINSSFTETLRLLVKAVKVRTFLLTHRWYELVDLPDVLLDESMLNTIILSFKSLRALDLHALKITSIPNSIRKLIHLKYLDVSFNEDIETLPDSITTLLNLQVLKLYGCKGLKELPKKFRELVNLKHLYNHGCDNLSHMPCGLGQMTSLQTLPLFIVSTSSHIGGLGELKELNNLRGTLEISHLERLEETNSESIVVNLREKQHLENLILKWYHQDQVGNNEDVKLLEDLQPHENLKYFEVYQYKGVKFSSWVSSHTNLVDLTIESCKRCRYLPPLSHLPFLKSIRLVTMNDLEYISDNDMSKEVPASSTTMSTPFFPSLKSLTIEGCPNLKGWWGRTGRDLVATTSASTPDHQQDQSHNSLPLFPLLSYLWIRDCPEMTSMPLFPNLEGSLYLNNVSLKPLQETMSMTFLVPSSSSSLSSSLINVVDLRIESCKRCRYLPPLSHLPSLKSVRLDTMNDLEYISDNDMSKEVPASSTTMSTPFFPSLKSLTIVECPNLKGWWGRTGRDLVATTSASTPDHQQDQSHNSLPLFPLLSSLWISNCPEMTSMPLFPNLEESLYLENVSLKPLQETMSMTFLVPSSSSSLSSSLINVVDLRIESCKRCRYLPPLSHLPSLKSLRLDMMNDLEYISDNDMSKEVPASSTTLSTPFFPSLKSLTIEACPNLKGWWGRTGRDLVATTSASTPDHQQHQSHNSLPLFPLLSSLWISNCPEMTSMPLFPNLEESLYLYNVSFKPLQETMSVSSSSLSSSSPLSKLNDMQLDSIEDIESLPAEWALYSLKQLGIWDCPRLTSMSGAVRNLTSLCRLSIVDCEEFDPFRDMHDDGMEWRWLNCLRDLRFEGIPKLKSLPVGLQCISTLKELRISNCPNLMTLPELTSLESLGIERCEPNLTSLLEISCLTSLQWLCIEDLPNLITFPESIRNPISLEKLSIWSCPNLTTLPDDGFLKSLRNLRIWNCPQLEEKYKNKIEKDFPNLEIKWARY